MAGEEALLAGGGGDTAALIGATGGIVQSATNLLGNYWLQENAYQRNLEQWNRANAYNDPSAVIARMERAGLNPVMMYSSGQGVSLAAPSPDYEATEFEAPNVAEGMLEGFKIRNEDVTTANLHAQNAVTRAQAAATTKKKEIDDWNLSIAKEVTAKTGIPMTTNDSPMNAGIKAVAGLKDWVENWMDRDAKNKNKVNKNVKIGKGRKK